MANQDSENLTLWHCISTRMDATTQRNIQKCTHQQMRDNLLGPFHTERKLKQNLASISKLRMSHS